MFHYFLFPLADHVFIFNVFRYITFRAGGGLLTALFIAFLMGTPTIDWLRARSRARASRSAPTVPQRHIVEKQGTPTMGGLLILVPAVIATLLWADLTDLYVWIVLLVMISCSVCSASADDYLKVTEALLRRRQRAREARRAVRRSRSSPTYAVMRLEDPSLAGGIAIPFVKSAFLLGLGWGFLAFGVLVIVGASNAVNLTDGLDGLAIVPVIIAALAFALIAYLVGNIKFADYLQLHSVAGTGELAVFLAALIGAGLGFLWYNAPPAMVFMGDTGSLALGGALGAVAVATKHEIVLAIVGGLFVMEAVSVIVQVVSFKTTGKRVFKMAPIHHHFEQLGWREPTIVIRFWIIAVVLALIGLSTLKLR